MTEASSPGLAGPDAVACVIPTHRRPRELRRALQSVAAQTRRPDAVVVVNDDDEVGPVDSAIGAMAASEHVGVMHIGRSDQSGASRSRNIGAAATDASIIAFLDDDDTWERTYLEEAIEALNTGKFDLVFTWIELTDRSGNRIRLRRGEVPKTAREIVSFNPGVTGSNVVITRAAFERIGGFDEGLRVYNDLDLLVRAVAAGLTIGVVQRALVQQRISSGEHLSSRSRSRAIGILAYADKHRAMLDWQDRRRIRRDYHLASRGRDQTWPARQTHLVLMLANSSPVQLWNVIIDRVRGAGNAYG